MIQIPSGRVLEGRIPSNKQKLVDAWVEIHKGELMPMTENTGYPCIWRYGLTFIQC